tara:strand:+ start:219 stop:1697 length:1479 start_codon:yes stop_codon:yes gene_type:complete
MTSSIVRERLANKLLTFLNKENSKARKGTLEKRAQIIHLDDKGLEFINGTIEYIRTKYPTLINATEIEFSKDDYKNAREIAERYQDSYLSSKSAQIYAGQAPLVENTYVGQWLKTNEPSVYKELTASPRTAFIVGSFNNLRQCKGEILDLFNFSQRDKAEISKRTDLGHGAAREGLAKSTVGAAGAMAQFRGKADEQGVNADALEDEFRDHMKKGADKIFKSTKAKVDVRGMVDGFVDSVFIDYEKVVTKTGKVRARYVPIIGFQSSFDNRQIDAPQEKALMQLVKEFIQKLPLTGPDGLVSMQSSPSIEDQVFAKIIHDFTDSLGKGADIEITLDSNLKKSKSNVKGKAGSRITKRASGQIKTTRRSLPTVAVKTSRAGRVNTTAGMSPIRLMALINAKLPQTVAGNMGEPRLVNRTGRFAGSARVTNITATPQGYPSIGYSYETNPYGVFEKSSGTRFASADRDPRTLIDASIREIATQLIAGRFYTRRI